MHDIKKNTRLRASIKLQSMSDSYVTTYNLHKNGNQPPELLLSGNMKKRIIVRYVCTSTENDEHITPRFNFILEYDIYLAPP